MLRRLLSFSGRYRILHLTWFAFLLSFVVIFNAAPLAGGIIEEFQLSELQFRTMLLCNLALAIPFRIIFGMLIDRIGPRIVFSGVLVYSAIPCIAFAFAQDYNQLLWSRLAIGVVAAGFVVGIRMVANWFPPAEIGFAEGIYGGWGNFGSGVAAIVLPLIATGASFFVGTQSSWRYTVALSGVVAAAYGVFYFFNVQDTPPDKEFKAAKHPGAIEVTTRRDFWLMTASNLPLYIALGVVAWRFAVVEALNPTAVVVICIALFCLYLFQTYWNWRVNKQLMAGQKRYAPEERYDFTQVVLLNLTYFVCFGSELAVVSMIPLFYLTTFNLSVALAGAVASSYAFMNLFARPGGGLISDTIGSRKWTLVILQAVTGVGYLTMGLINVGWLLPMAIGVTMFASFSVQAAEGATYAIVPLIKEEITGQIAGSVGAWGNVGGVAFLLLFSFLPTGDAGNRIFFSTMGISSLIMFFLLWFFLKEPTSTHGEEELELQPSVASSQPVGK
ncbi:NarK family nitrate/nitrite MFS transporter [cf. Phormidesmis sp. LEGE 11477]|uniref:NarK family nitrate/nitrite MFS transporter n=1 Tax=cf. Phormidesmis sp. LEGE 11477 TaxID=1828680 RepID=UPI001881505E|nr:NarK family nitrate/nitrite MFS transporter [cf. Phormidesmis sp. LEGE 11477]MBE9062116.1 NarK family nitrate/nitrite MFS transporter [cf. Phormidesmis sp. LEGE 11477]